MKRGGRKREMTEEEGRSREGRGAIKGGMDEEEDGQKSEWMKRGRP